MYIRLLIFYCLITGYTIAQRKEQCSAYGWDYPTVSYTVNIENVKNDAVHVTAKIEGGKKRSLIFCLPVAVPGIYGPLDFAQQASNFSALDGTGQVLETERIDNNRWKIKNTHHTNVTVHYDVGDHWEEFDEKAPEGYLSAKSMFRENDVFVINHNALFGYFEGTQTNNIQLEVIKSAALTGYTSLNKRILSETSDLYYASSYREMVDSPLLYCASEPATFHIADVSVDVVMYSTSGKSLAPEIAQTIRPLMEHQKNYLGGELPVEHYTFLLYHCENTDPNSYRWDGLEHNSSTLILMFTSLDTEMIRKNMYGVASHEFFHTIMPLGIHSREIADYNFNKPKLSRHLWLYEGMTEYFTIHMPVKERLISKEDFLKSVQQKLDQTSAYAHEQSLAYLSTHAMEQQDQYMDFYAKGTLLNLCLDIHLRELSGGTYGVQLLVADLLKKYGPYRSFKDKELFRKIAELAKQPGLKRFFRDYVEGTKPLPLKEYFSKVGIDYDEQTNRVSWNSVPTEEQLKLRQAWIGN